MLLAFPPIEPFDLITQDKTDHTKQIVDYPVLIANNDKKPMSNVLSVRQSKYEFGPCP